MKRKMIFENVSSFNDFITKIQDKTIFFAYGSIQPCLCLNIAHMYYFSYSNNYTEKQLNIDILNNKEMFTWELKNNFYYANDNMFSNSNAENGLKGYMLKLL